MPVALNHPTAAAHRGRLYVHGGYRGEADLTGPTGALLRYHPQRRRWRRLPSSPTPRAAHALAAIRGRLYAAGGANDSGSLRSLEIYDIRRARWRRGPSFPGPARNHTTGVASGGRFYVLAGRDAGNLTAAERYDPRRRVWRELPPLRVARGGIASARVSDGRIVVFGGERLEPGGTTICRGRAVRPPPQPLELAARPSHPAPRAGRSGEGPQGLRDPGRAHARLRLLERDRVPRRAAAPLDHPGAPGRAGGGLRNPLYRVRFAAHPPPAPVIFRPSGRRRSRRADGPRPRDAAPTPGTPSRADG